MKVTYKISIILVLVVALTFASAINLHAEKAKKDEAVEEMRFLKGEVTSLYPRNEPNQIGITHVETDADYFFKLAEEVKVVHKKNLKEIQLGDTVELIFKHKSNKYSGDMIERIVTTIKFIKSAKKSG